MEYNIIQLNIYIYNYLIGILDLTLHSAYIINKAPSEVF